jgi:predicted tellurium resistance membrane protein TerC
VILQIMVVDLVFSLDSIITAVGMVDDVRDHDRRRGGSVA